ncbi:uncharacterized protein TM35_000072680 [Trypanosoma theileri]|uniref:Uncharacterized protein n=1 Tax=Trypanosoma theileri TaxID=67003 RepID=A0A1X0P1L2_9TRYP|nr:uncharacterized protein TM35_000072680 [Trypanosoma theileri]ORC90844.1 hypothetical protein TM35_000072680 [Trypanosoma theileri]
MELESDVAAVVSQACELVRQLDAAIGPPPFTAPSPPAARTIALELVRLLRAVNSSGRTAMLAAHNEITRTLPVLCAALTTGAVDRQPCKLLMELLLEALVYVHAISLYPLQSTLKDALEVLPQSPVTFRLFVVAGAIDVDKMRSFLGIPQEPKKDQEKGNSSKKKRQSANQKKNVPQEMNSIGTNKMIEVPREILNVALDVVLPQDCIKVFISLFDSSSKFQYMVRNDTELATRVLNVYGDYILPSLRPTSFIDCLGVSLLDIFVDVVKMNGENMSLLTDSVLTKISVTEWSTERLVHLIRYCVERKVCKDEAFASLVVYTFIYRLLLLVSEVHDLTWFPIEDEAKLFGAVLHAAEIMPFSTGILPTIEEERLIKPLSILAEGIKRRHTITSLTKVSSIISYGTITTVLKMLKESLDAKLKPPCNTTTTTTTGSSKKKKGSKNNSKKTVVPPVTTTTSSSSSLSVSFTNAVDDYCKMMMESISLLLWLSPDEMVKSNSGLVCNTLESVAALLLPTTPTTVEEKTRRMPQTSTWECFLNLLLSILNMQNMNSTTFILSQKGKAALLLAVQATHRLEVCGILAQRMPNIYAANSWSPSNYKVLLDAWITANTHVEKFYLPIFTLTSIESIELILALMDDAYLMELVQLLLNTESSLITLIPALKKVILSEDKSNNSLGKELTGLSRLYESLLKTQEGRARTLEEEQQKKETEKRIRVLEAIQEKEELLANTKEFEREAQKRREAKEEEQMRIQRIREERQREKERKREQERKEQQVRRQKAAALVKEMALRTKVERLAEQQERLQRYRARVSSMTRMSTFLESVQLTPSRIMQVLLALRPYLPSMTHDDLLEFVVTGNRKVPNDMHTVENVDSSGNLKSPDKEERVCFSDEVPSFWDSVMQLVAQESGTDTGNTLEFVEKENEKETYNDVKDIGVSFHKRVRIVLDLFDYSTGTNEALPDLLPSLNIRHAVRLLNSNKMFNGQELLLSCQQRGLCVMNNGVCTLTALGFRYHFPFHDPEMMLDIQFERRRAEVRAMLADVEPDDSDDYEDEESMNSSYQEEEEEDDDVVCFADELI